MDPNRRMGSRPRSAPVNFRKRHRRRLAIWLSVLTFFVLVLAAAAVLGDAYLQSYHAYQDARAILPNLDKARSYLAKGQIPPGDPFLQASSAAGKAGRDLSGARFTLPLVEKIPFFNRPIKAVRLGVQAATQEAAAATGMRDIVKDVLGPAALTGAPATADESTPIYAHGVANVKLIQSLTPRLEQVIGHLQAGDRYVNAIPSVPFVHHLDTLKADAVAQSSKAVALARNALSAVRLLPGFLGANGPRAYLLALQQDSDLRGTGGGMAAFGLMTIDRGKIQLVEAGGQHDITVNGHNGQIYVTLPPAVQWWVKNVPHNFSWVNGVNYTPDFPAVADTWARMVGQAFHRKVDGVVLIDPVGISQLMGSKVLHVPVYPERITRRTVVSAVANKQYLLSRADQRAFTTQLVRHAFPIFTSLHPLVKTVKQYGLSLRTKHLQMWSVSPQQEALIHELGWDGGTHVDRGDYLYAVDNHVINGKVDYYTHTHIDYRVVVGKSGALKSTCTVTLDNRTPEGLPGSIAGGRKIDGLNRAYISLYAPATAKPISLSPGEGLPTHREGPAQVFVRLIEAPRGGSAAARYAYSVPHGVLSTAEGKVYQLTVQHQPLVNPTDLTVTVTLPPGSSVKSMGAGWSSPGGSVARLHVTLTQDLVTRIVF